MKINMSSPYVEGGVVVSLTLIGLGATYAGLCFAANQLDKIMVRRELLYAWRRTGRWYR